MSAKEIEDSLKGIQSKLETDLEKKEVKIKKEIDGYMTALKKIADNPSIFDAKIEFKFSQELHHTGVQVVTDTLIKSTGIFL